MTNSSDAGFLHTQQAIHRQLMAMPHGVYRVRLIHHQTRRPLRGERLWTADQLLRSANIKFLRIRNREGFDIYIHPDEWDQNAGYILVDLDHAANGVLQRMRDNGHDPCVVVETSPGHLQAWIRVSATPLEPGLATAIARNLACRYQGDPASADWRHLGRLAGFTNQKPERRTFYGDAPWVKIVHARAVLAPGGQALIESARRSPAEQCAATTTFEADPAAACVSPEQASYIYQDLLQRWQIAERFAPPDWSIVDLWVARHLLSWGVPPNRVAEIIRLGSPQFPRRHGDAADYLRRTLDRAVLSFRSQRGPG
jgi:hypothetical protein